MPAPQGASAIAQRDTSGTQATLFIADVNTNVLLYTADISQQHPPLLGEITQGVTRSVGVCTDREGTLYILNSGGSRPSIGEYHRGSTTPFKTITYGLDTPSACVVDRGLRLYVADGEGANPLVQIYSPSGFVEKSIEIPRVGRATTPGGVVLNKRDAIFVSMFSVESSTGVVFKINRGSSTAKNLNLQNVPGGALGIDKAGNLYTGGHDGNIAIYAPGSTSPSRTIGVNDEGFYSDMAVTPNGTIYWPNYDEGAMYEFAPGAPSPTNVFSTSGSGVGAAVGSW
jgi:hypothetical protein